MSSDAGLRYAVPSRIYRVEELIQRSRFITTAAHAPDANAANAFVDSVRELFPDATHHCWAFVAGPPGSTAHIGMSDDGEPHGTAGRPMLTILLHSGVGEIVTVCTRYFGGVKLGTGGLSRAYAGGVKLLLQTLPTELKIKRVHVSVRVAYPHVESLQRLLDDLEVIVEHEDYGEEVRYQIAVPVMTLGTLREQLAQLTSGEGVLE
ncbi:MAG: YigZ family protein [bacterium]|nr:YigZ family protein [Gemmatimonadota bacterium]HIL88896.1 YigZ family protein [Gemmatimonadota bacterium]